jgi:XTP/dITP diphosphohydrolase
MEIVLASANAGKLRELQAMTAVLGFEVRAQSEFGVEAVPETGVTFVENALIKARHAARCTGRPAIADDSGLVVDALGGAPGIRSARYAGEDASDADNVGKLLAALADVPPSARTCRFVCVLAWLRAPEDPLPLIASGVWEGQVVTGAPRGANGFGYDPVFLVPGHGCTAAELDPATKQRLSHRGRAMAALAAALAQARGASRPAPAPC